jgi:hypothetical protein
MVQAADSSWHSAVSWLRIFVVLTEAL